MLDAHLSPKSYKKMSNKYAPHANRARTVQPCGLVWPILYLTPLKGLQSFETLRSCPSFADNFRATTDKVGHTPSALAPSPPLSLCPIEALIQWALSLLLPPLSLSFSLSPNLSMFRYAPAWHSTNLYRIIPVVNWYKSILLA